MQSLQVKILDERMRDQLPTYGTPGSAGTRPARLH